MDAQPAQDREPAQDRRETAPIIFVGGTGRSGTHIIGKLLGRSADLALVPVECRFHVEPRGFPGLLSGEVSKRRFLRRMRGFWWKGWQGTRRRGMHKFIEKEHYHAALDAFSERFDDDAEEACRRLFYDLLWPRAERKGAKGIVEQSTDVVAAGATLARLFPEARFVHVIRDGRDASASRVSQTHGIIYPRNRAQGLAWWEKRMSRIAAGIESIPPDRILEVSIDELVASKFARALLPITDFAGVAPGYRVRRYYKSRMNSERANQGRWRRDLTVCDAKEVDEVYAAALDRLEAAGSTAVPRLRRSMSFVPPPPDEIGREAEDLGGAVP